MDIKQSVKFSINNIIHEGLTDIFPRPFEVDLLKDNGIKGSISKNITDAISDALDNSEGLQTLRMHQIHHVLYPKKEAFDFRKCALIEPLDTIKYLSIVLLIAKEIEKNRIPASENIVFSYRLKIEDDGKHIFNRNNSYNTFNNYVNNKTKERSTKVLVKCDISNFYDRLNLHRLESILRSLSIDPKIVTLINEILLFWANRDSYGLPVGSNPSRILAEAALIDIDKFLLSHDIQYCRYVDDFRLFAPDAKTAHYWLTLLIERLSLEGLFINQSKTSIEDVADKKKDTNIPNENFQVDNENQTKDKKIISGYSGTIPTKFRRASENEVDKISNTDYKDLIKHIGSSKVILPEEFREYCKVILYKKMYSKFKSLPDLLNKFPQFTPYVIDLLIKHNEEIPKKTKNYLRDSFSKLLTSGIYVPEYITISIVKLLSTDDYENITVLFDYFRALRRNAGSYIGRATLEALEPLIERGQVLEIRQYYNRADMWEKRQIVRIVKKHLHKEEKNAWFKNIKMNETSDLFLIHTVNSK